MSETPPVAAPPPAENPPPPPAPEVNLAAPLAPEQAAPSTDLNAVADKLNEGSADPDAALKQLAENPSAFGDAPKDDDQQSVTPQVDQAEARHNELMNMNTDQLRELAAKGDKDAESVLKNMESGNQTATPEATAPTPEQTPEGYAPTEPPVQTEAGTPPPPQPESPQPVAAETPEPPASTETTEQTGENSTTENTADTEQTPEQETIKSRIEVVDRVHTLVKLGVDMNSEQGLDVLKLIAENPHYASDYEAALVAAQSNEQLGGPKAAAAAAEATANTLDEAITKADTDGNTQESLRLKFLKGLLKALGVALVAGLTYVRDAGQETGVQIAKPVKI